MVIDTTFGERSCETKITGELAVRDIIEHVKNLTKRLGQDDYVEFVEIDSRANLNIKLEEIREIANFAGLVAEHSHLHHIVFFASTGIHYGILRIFETLVHTRFNSVKVQVFRDLKKGREQFAMIKHSLEATHRSSAG